MSSTSSSTRREAAGGLALVAAAALAALAPQVETLPSEETVDAALPEEDVVRVPSGDGALVYDKREGWFAAKAAEFFPRAAVRVLPADYVEDGSGVVRRGRISVRGPWWR